MNSICQEIKTHQLAANIMGKIQPTNNKEKTQTHLVVWT